MPLCKEPESLYRARFFLRDTMIDEALRKGTVGQLIKNFDAYVAKVKDKPVENVVIDKLEEMRTKLIRHLSERLNEEDEKTEMRQKELEAELREVEARRKAVNANVEAIQAEAKPKEEELKHK